MTEQAKRELGEAIVAAIVRRLEEGPERAGIPLLWPADGVVCPVCGCEVEPGYFMWDQPPPPAAGGDPMPCLMMCDGCFYRHAEAGLTWKPLYLAAALRFVSRQEPA
jgi:hypothetical protein